MPRLDGQVRRAGPTARRRPGVVPERRLGIRGRLLKAGRVRSGPGLSVSPLNVRASAGGRHFWHLQPGAYSRHGPGSRLLQRPVRRHHRNPQNPQGRETHHLAAHHRHHEPAGRPVRPVRRQPGRRIRGFENASIPNLANTKKNSCTQSVGSYEGDTKVADTAVAAVPAATATRRRPQPPSRPWPAARASPRPAPAPAPCRSPLRAPPSSPPVPQPSSYCAAARPRTSRATGCHEDLTSSGEDLRAAPRRAARLGSHLSDQRPHHGRQVLRSDPPFHGGSSAPAAYGTCLGHPGHAIVSRQGWLLTNRAGRWR